MDAGIADGAVLGGDGFGGAGGGLPMDAGVDGGPGDAALDATMDPLRDAEIDYEPPDPDDPVACTPADAADVCGGGGCVDGYCCDTDCDAQCEACDVAGSEGLCTPVPDGTADALTGTACDGPDTDLCTDDSYGACMQGSVVCEAGTDDLELCDGVDNDCDPATPDGSDEATFGDICDGDDPDQCPSGAIACDGAALFCTDADDADPELCDGIDNDCDPNTPDGADEPTLGNGCDGGDSDLCNEGVIACGGGVLACNDATGDSLEVCDGADNDCNGATADGADEPTLGDGCDGGDSDLCNEGVIACGGGVLACNDATGDSLEVCDGADNDCNGATADGADEPTLGNGCDGGDSDLCEEGVIACGGGVLACNDATGDSLEVCDGADNDCNGATADGADEPTLGNGCDGGDSDLCNEGVIACGGGVLACNDATGDSLEVCDGADNDCDLETDESGWNNDWWDWRWSHRNKLEFLNGGQAQTLTSFPVLVKLANANFSYANAKGDGTDLRFISSDGATELTYHIERWTPGGDSYVWVNVDAIDANSNTDFMWMYHGNVDAADVRDVAGTYDLYRAVYHLSETSRTSGAYNDHLDSAQGSHAEAVNFSGGGLNPSVTGQIGGADDFDGNNDYVEVDNGGTVDDIFNGGGTVSAWIYPQGWGENSFGRIADKSNNTSATLGWSFQLDNGNTTGALRFEVGFSGGQGGWLCPANSITLGSWQHVAVTYDDDSAGNDATLYVNGISCSATRVQSHSGSWPGDSSYVMRLGTWSGGTTRTFDGLIDEVRFSSVPRTQPWLRAQALSHADTFLNRVGEEQDTCQ